MRSSRIETILYRIFTSNLLFVISVYGNGYYFPYVFFMLTLSKGLQLTMRFNFYIRLVLSSSIHMCTRCLLLLQKGLMLKKKILL